MSALDCEAISHHPSLLLAVSQWRTPCGGKSESVAFGNVFKIFKVGNPVKRENNDDNSWTNDF